MSRAAKLILVYLGAGIVLAGFSAITLILMALLAGGLDVGHELGIGDRPVNLIALSGGLVVAGLFVARLLKARGVWLVVMATWLPAVIAQGVAWAILGTSDLDTETLIIGSLSLAIGEFVAVKTPEDVSTPGAVTPAARTVTLGGLRSWTRKLWISVLGGGVLAGVVMGVLTGLTITDAPSGPPEIYLVIKDYSVDAVTGECSGSGAMSGVVAGSRLLIFPSHVGADNVGEEDDLLAAVLPAGREDTEPATGCVFELGDPLRLDIQGYTELFYWHESDLDAAQEVFTDANRVIISYLSEETSHQLGPEQVWFVRRPFVSRSRRSVVIELMLPHN